MLCLTCETPDFPSHAGGISDCAPLGCATPDSPPRTCETTEMAGDQRARASQSARVTPERMLHRLRASA